jgi:TPR repeat protein
MSKAANSDDARFVLGRLMVEGASDLVPKNENKGLNWIKEAAKRGHMPSLEYKTYWDIRFERTPNLQKITENLNKIVDSLGSCRALNTLGELNHATGSGSMNSENPEMRQAAQAKAVLAAKYYQLSSEKEDVIGTHWLGVFYHEGFGVNKNLDKAIELLTRSSKAGNGQSYYQLYLIHSGNSHEDERYKRI